jgi:hypothetical protein
VFGLVEGGEGMNWRVALQLIESERVHHRMLGTTLCVSLVPPCPRAVSTLFFQNREMRDIIILLEMHHSTPLFFYSTE